jgi:hypothetical protein
MKAWEMFAWLGALVVGLVIFYKFFQSNSVPSNFNNNTSAASSTDYSSMIDSLTSGLSANFSNDDGS